ncbi:hypothetical protein HK096_007736 [Nowakowskiella sp. JEL0078]|nr:hypothetical protein HK096_007736 [Nowakowskiella sp. JEL0078]
MLGCASIHLSKIVLAQQIMSFQKIAFTIFAGVGTLLSCVYFSALYTKSGRSVARKMLLKFYNSLPNPLTPSVKFADRVQKHGPLEKICDGLWVVKGSMPAPFPDGFYRVMVVYQPPKSKSLLLFSVLCLDEATLKEIDELGTVTHIYVPCSWHTLDASAYKDRYPKAKVVAPRKAIARVVGKTEVDVAAEAIFAYVGEENGDRSELLVPSGTMEEHVRIIELQGVSDEFDELTLLVDLANSFDGTKKRALLLNDLIFNEPPKPPTLFRRIFRVKDEAMSKFSLIINVGSISQFRMWLRNVLLDLVVKEEVEVLTFSHGEPISGKDATRKFIHNFAYSF